MKTRDTTSCDRRRCIPGKLATAFSRGAAALRPTLRRGDLVIVTLSALAVGALAMHVYGLSHAIPNHLGDCTGLCLEVHQASAARNLIPLDHSQILELHGPAGTTRVEIEPGRARCAVSPGIHRVCQRAGWLEAPGDHAISLPNRIQLRVVRGEPAYDTLHY